MSLHLIYKNLFEVKILHHYFLNNGEEGWDSMDQDEKDKIEAKYDIRDVIEIVPTPDCFKSLSSHNCIFKQTAAGILVGIKAKPDVLHPGEFQPFIPLSEDLTFRFMIRLKDYNFPNYTMLPLQGNKGKMFIFNNNNLNASITFPSLSAIPPLFENGTEYLPGDMLSDDADNQTKLFTALVKTGENPSGSDDWLTETGDAETPLSYVNVNDRHPVANGFFTYTMKEEDSYPIATMKDSSGNTIKPKVEILPGDFYTLQIDMQQYPQGFYSIHIDSDNPAYHDDVTFYLLNMGETPFGLIEIKANSNQDGYDLVEDDQLLSPVFELRFRNRRTHWRYVGVIFDEDSFTASPYPLTRSGFIEDITVKDKDDNDVTNLPNPSVPLIKPEEERHYSDIHIN